MAFYGDAVERFHLMAESGSNEPIDAAHFKMWCRIAEEEIETLRAAFRINMVRLNPKLTHDDIDKFFKRLSPENPLSLLNPSDKKVDA